MKKKKTLYSTEKVQSEWTRLFILLCRLFLFLLFLLHLRHLRLRLHDVNSPLLFLRRRGLTTVCRDLFLHLWFLLSCRLLFLFLLYGIRFLLKNKRKPLTPRMKHQTSDYQAQRWSCPAHFSDQTHRVGPVNGSEEICFSMTRYETGPWEGPASSIYMLFNIFRYHGNPKYDQNMTKKKVSILKLHSAL